MWLRLPRSYTAYLGQTPKLSPCILGTDLQCLDERPQLEMGERSAHCLGHRFVSHELELNHLNTDVLVPVGSAWHAPKPQ